MPNFSIRFKFLGLILFNNSHQSTFSLWVNSELFHAVQLRLHICVEEGPHGPHRLRDHAHHPSHPLHRPGLRLGERFKF
jgi:hypothetical protein